MKVEKIIFMQTFPTTSFANQKLGVEIIIEDLDIRGRPQSNVTEEAFQFAKKIVNDAFKSINPEFNLSSSPSPVDKEIVPEKTREEELANIIKEINECTDIDTLGTYNIVVKVFPEAQLHYDKQWSKLCPF